VTSVDVTSARVLELLTAALGDRVVTSPDVLDEARADKSGHRSDAPPLAVVEAASIDDVQQTLRIATETGTPVVPRGAGTGLAGGAIASGGEIALSLRTMDRVLEIDENDLIAVVEPGILNGDFGRILAERGLWFAPDPASKEISTVGGNIATNAGGLLCAKYGVTRDAVLALKIVLADGTLMSLGHRSVKGVTGLDLTALLVGSEGILGVIVEATVRLRRAVPGAVTTLAATFPHVTDAAAACSAITAAGIQPAVMELLEPTALAAIHDYLGLEAPTPGRTQIMVQTDGPLSADDARACLAIIEANGGVGEVAANEADGERLLSIRRAMHPAMEKLGHPLIEDVSVPRSALVPMFEAIQEVEREFGISIPTVAHAGDGNLHPNFVYQGDEVPEVIWQAADALFLSAIRLGGTLTGEHGIGILKRRWLEAELGAEQVDLQRRIKATFDPQGLLNPGKVFDPIV